MLVRNSNRVLSCTKTRPISVNLGCFCHISQHGSTCGMHDFAARVVLRLLPSANSAFLSCHAHRPNSTHEAAAEPQLHGDSIMSARSVLLCMQLPMLCSPTAPGTSAQLPSHSRWGHLQGCEGWRCTRAHQHTLQAHTRTHNTHTHTTQGLANRPGVLHTAALEVLPVHSVGGSNFVPENFSICADPPYSKYWKSPDAGERAVLQHCPCDNCPMLPAYTPFGCHISDVKRQVGGELG